MLKWKDFSDVADENDQVLPVKMTKFRSVT